MNPFLELPIVIRVQQKNTVNLKGGWLKKKSVSTTNYSEVVVTGRILPGEIAAHHADEQNRSVLYMRNGNCVTTLLTANDIDSARQIYDQMLKKNPGRTENLQIVQKPPVEKKEKIEAEKPAA
jgi:hypothetical protein